MSYSDGTPSVTFASYSRQGQPKSITDHTGTRTLEYCECGKPIYEVLPSAFFGSRKLTWKIDATTSGALGRSYGVTVAENNVSEYDVTYGFDASGRFNSNAGFTYTYTTNSHLLASIAHSASGWAQYRTYLANANALDIIETKVSTTSKAKFDHTHDSLYRATTILKTGEQFSTYGNGTQGIETDHDYNDRGEVIADSTALGGTSTPLTGRDDYFGYDPIGNRASVNRSGSTIAYTSNNLNQYSSFTGSATHTYDHDGNLTYDGQWNYTWDAENRLIAQETASGVTPAKKLEFKYDYRHRRVRKISYTWGGAAWVTAADLKCVYDGDNQLLELNAASSNAKVGAHIWGLDLSGTLRGAGGVGGLLYTYDYATSTTMLPAYDGNGNISHYVNASTGAIIAKFEYDAFGRTIAESGTHVAAARFRFATKYADTESGLVHYNRRPYSPSLARFLGRDPIQEQGGLNLYAYVLNNPVGRYDYLGMFAVRGRSGGDTREDYYEGEDKPTPSDIYIPPPVFTPVPGSHVPRDGTGVGLTISIQRTHREPNRAEDAAIARREKRRQKIAPRETTIDGNVVVMDPFLLNGRNGSSIIIYSKSELDSGGDPRLASDLKDAGSARYNKGINISIDIDEAEATGVSVNQYIQAQLGRKKYDNVIFSYHGGPNGEADVNVQALFGPDSSLHEALSRNLTGSGVVLYVVCYGCAPDSSDSLQRVADIYGMNVLTSAGLGPVLVSTVAFIPTVSEDPDDPNSPYSAGAWKITKANTEPRTP